MELFEQWDDTMFAGGVIGSFNPGLTNSLMINLVLFLLAFQLFFNNFLKPFGVSHWISIRIMGKLLIVMSMKMQLEMLFR